MDNENFQLTIIAIASVTIVALLTFLASRPSPQLEPPTANLPAPTNAMPARETSDIHKGAADQSGAAVVEDRIASETKQEPKKQIPAMEGNSFPSTMREFRLRSQIFPDRETTSEKAENSSYPKSAQAHCRAKAALSISRKRPAYHRAAIKNEFPYGPLPNRKGEYRFPDTESESNPFSEFLLGF